MSTFHTSASSPHNPLHILLSQNTTTFYFPLPTDDTEEGLRALRQGSPPAPPCPRLPTALHLGCSSTRARWGARLQELRCLPKSLQSRARLVRRSKMIYPQVKNHWEAWCPPLSLLYPTLSCFWHLLLPAVPVPASQLGKLSSSL